MAINCEFELVSGGIRCRRCGSLIPLLRTTKVYANCQIEPINVSQRDPEECHGCSQKAAAKKESRSSSSSAYAADRMGGSEN